MRTFFLLLTIICFSNGFGQVRREYVKDSLQNVSNAAYKVDIKTQNIPYQKLISPSDVDKNLQYLQQNNYYFNQNNSNISTSKTKTIYNPSGSGSKKAAIFNGAASVLGLSFKKKFN